MADQNQRPAAATPPTADGAVEYGGSQPSELIDPGEWLAVADAYARSVPADTAALAADGLATARSMLAHAAAGAIPRPSIPSGWCSSAIATA